MAMGANLRITTVQPRWQYFFSQLWWQCCINFLRKNGTRHVRHDILSYSQISVIMNRTVIWITRHLTEFNHYESSFPAHWGPLGYGRKQDNIHQVQVAPGCATQKKDMKSARQYNQLHQSENFKRVQICQKSFTKHTTITEIGTIDQITFSIPGISIGCIPAKPWESKLQGKMLTFCTASSSLDKVYANITLHEKLLQVSSHLLSIHL